jgi:hypothetical protein
MAGIFPLAEDIKVFCFFSSEKKGLSFYHQEFMRRWWWWTIYGNVKHRGNETNGARDAVGSCVAGGCMLASGEQRADWHATAFGVQDNPPRRARCHIAAAGDWVAAGWFRGWEWG